MTQGPRQTPAFRSYDGVFRYTDPTGHEGRCHLQVFERRGALPTVMYVICNHRGVREEDRVIARRLLAGLDGGVEAM